MKTKVNHKTICGRSQQAVLNTIESFHGWKAPGIVLGAIMVDWAQELIGPDIESDAIVETRYCLPDAVQLFTLCTIGNGWLKILDWDKFALSLYDRKNLAGYRIWLNLELAKKSASCLEFIVVHEMVHLIERHHNDRFKELMDRLIPQWRMHREALNRTPLPPWPPATPTGRYVGDTSHSRVHWWHL